MSRVRILVRPLATIMNFSDIQIYCSIKIILVLFVVLAIYLIAKKKNPLYLLTAFGLASATTYGLWANNLQLPLWGLQGDELTISAMFNAFAHVGLGADFGYHSLPAFYPPAFFWLFGAIGHLLDWNGIVMAKAAAASFMLIFPAGLFMIQRRLFKNILSEPGFNYLLASLTPLLILSVLDKDLLIGKPYEIIAAVATILWSVSLAWQANHRPRWSLGLVLAYGLTGGLICMTYYLWLIFAAMALLLIGLLEKSSRHWAYFWRLTTTAIIAIITSLPFTGPLLISYFKYGLESWQTAFFVPDGLNLWLPMLQSINWTSLIWLFGLATLIYCRRQPIIRQLGYLFSTAFLWWLGGLLSLLFLHKPFQEFRGFYIWAPTLLAIAAAYGLSRLWCHYKISQQANLSLTLAIIGLFYVVGQSFFGFFVDDPVVKNRHSQSKVAEPAITRLASYLTADPLTDSALTLETTPQLLAFVPINNLLYFNQHNGHPAAIFSKRYSYVQSLAAAKTPAELKQKIQDCPFGQLKRFIFYSHGQNYYLYFHLDKFIDGIEEKQIIFDQKLFTPQYFDLTYDHDGYRVFEVR